LEADGSILASAINGTSVAMADAGLPMRDLVTACSASMVNDTPIVDLTHVEEMACGSVLTLGLLPAKRAQAFLEMSSRFHFENVDQVSRAAEDGCARIYKYLGGEVTQMIRYLSERLDLES
jgi:exosome complex component RRP41